MTRWRSAHDASCRSHRDRAVVDTHQSFKRATWRDNREVCGSRELAEETAVAISYNGSTHAVLMATPADLEDLGVGFSVTEGIVAQIDEIESIDVVPFETGLDIQIRVREDIADRLVKRRRSMAGPVGCGMCGLESLDAASRDVMPVRRLVVFKPADIILAIKSIEQHQRLNHATGAAHAAGYFVPGQATSHVREDVGRHNALDKVIGALLRSGTPIADGAFAVTSRVSVELVQKAAVVGCGLLAAISAPTAFAIRTAIRANVTVAAVVRGDSFEVFSQSDRISSGAIADVA